jgi:hypothetical protein
LNEQPQGIDIAPNVARHAAILITSTTGGTRRLRVAKPVSATPARHPYP